LFRPTSKTLESNLQPGANGESVSCQKARASSTRTERTGVIVLPLSIGHAVSATCPVAESTKLVGFNIEKRFLIFDHKLWTTHLADVELTQCRSNAMEVPGAAKACMNSGLVLALVAQDRTTSP
jgi:hypothetical protein